MSHWFSSWPRRQPQLVRIKMTRRGKFRRRTARAPISFSGRHLRRFRGKGSGFARHYSCAHNGRPGMTALVQRDNSIARAITSGISASSQTAEKDIPKRYKDYFRLSRRTLESACRILIFFSRLLLFFFLRASLRESPRGLMGND